MKYNAKYEKMITGGERTWGRKSVGYTTDMIEEVEQRRDDPKWRRVIHAAFTRLVVDYLLYSGFDKTLDDTTALELMCWSIKELEQSGITGRKKKMTTAACRKSGRKHTPITTEKQRGKFGSEYGRRKAGKKGRMSGITTEELKSHLEESGGKRLPKKARKRR